MAKFGYIRDRSNSGSIPAGLLFELDGGFAFCVYLNPEQYLSGGNASSLYSPTQFINAGGA